MRNDLTIYFVLSLSYEIDFFNFFWQATPNGWYFISYNTNSQCSHMFVMYDLIRAVYQSPLVHWNCWRHSITVPSSQLEEQLFLKLPLMIAPKLRFYPLLSPLPWSPEEPCWSQNDPLRVVWLIGVSAGGMPILINSLSTPNKWRRYYSWA